MPDLDPVKRTARCKVPASPSDVFHGDVFHGDVGFRPNPRGCTAFKMHILDACILILSGLNK